MWRPFPDSDGEIHSIASTLWTMGIGLFIALWVVWTVVTPFWAGRGEAAARGTGNEPDSVVVPVQPRLQGIDLRRATDLLVDAIVQIESQGNPEKVGGVGERGLMQIRESTWREVTTRHYGEPVSFDRAFEPGLNRQVGRWYLGYLQAFLYRHQSRWRSDLRSLLLASYNAGPDRVRLAHFDLRRLPQSVQSYAERGSNLHDWYLQKDAETLRRLMDGQQPEEAEGTE